MQSMPNHFQAAWFGIRVSISRSGKDMLRRSEKSNPGATRSILAMSDLGRDGDAPARRTEKDSIDALASNGVAAD
jgi:hypothetical protein